MNTYQTIESQWTPCETKNAKLTDIVTFASPSAVRCWAARAGTEYATVCLGPTTHREAKRLKFKESHYCETCRGVTAFVDLIVKVAKQRFHAKNSPDVM